MAAERTSTFKRIAILATAVAVLAPLFHWFYYSSPVAFFAIPFLGLGVLGFGSKGTYYRLVAIAILIAFGITFLITTQE